MARTFTLTRYPMLKVLLPAAFVVFGIGLVVFFMQSGPDGSLDPQPLLWYGLAATAIAFSALLWKRKEKVQVVLPSDRLHDASRKDLEAILQTLERQRDKGELTQERYTKARNKVLREMKGGK